MSSDREKMETPAVLWHYTVMHCLRPILAEGVIRPPTVGLAKKQKGVVWFSASPDWDPSANRWWRSPEGSLVHLTRDQTIVLGAGLARIGVAAEVAQLDWKAYKSQSGVPAKLAKVLYDAAIKAGSRPGLWYATFECVPRSQWRAVEVWDDEGYWAAQKF
jgi:hypothetical protein